MDEQPEGYSKCVREFVKQIEEQRIRLVLPKKPIPAPRNHRKHCTISYASDDIKAITSEDTKRCPPIKLQRSKTFTADEKPSQTSNQEQTFNEDQLETDIKSFTSSEIHHLETLEIIIPVFLMAIKKRSTIEPDISIEAIECLVDRLIEGQTKFVLDDLYNAETYEKVLDCFCKNKDLFYFYREFFQQKWSFLRFSVIHPKTNFTSEINLRHILNERISVYKKFLLSNSHKDTEKFLSLLNWTTAVDVNLKLKISKPLTVVHDTDRFFVGQEIPETFFTQPSTVTKYGRYYLHNKFKVKMKDFGTNTLWVHLFTKIMLFTEKTKNGYLYKFHLDMYEIGYSPARNTENMVEITHYVNLRPLLTYDLEGHPKDVDNWKRNIENILQEQQEQAKEEISQYKWDSPNEV